MYKSQVFMSNAAEDIWFKIVQLRHIVFSPSCAVLNFDDWLQFVCLDYAAVC